MYIRISTYIYMEVGIVVSIDTFAKVLTTATTTIKREKPFRHVVWNPDNATSNSTTEHRDRLLDVSAAE